MEGDLGSQRLPTPVAALLSLPPARTKQTLSSQQPPWRQLSQQQPQDRAPVTSRFLAWTEILHRAMEIPAVHLLPAISACLHRGSRAAPHRHRSSQQDTDDTASQSAARLPDCDHSFCW